KANISNDSHVLRLKASKSGPLNKHAEERENFHAVISTPRVAEQQCIEWHTHLITEGVQL
ncbi:hypothetical protein Tco_0547029, partial [Tanacetum coccineum]